MFRVLGLRVWGLGFGFGVYDIEFRDWCLGFRV